MATATTAMNRSSEALYRPAEVAKMLDCSEWWIKEQARKRRIPYSWIGGSYRFTTQHVAEIIRLFEVTATGLGEPAVPAVAPQRRRQIEATVTRLTARTPPRARTTSTHAGSAA